MGLVVKVGKCKMCILDKTESQNQELYKIYGLLTMKSECHIC